MAEAASISREERSRSLNELYWTDCYTWAMQQADALRRRDFAAVDWDNVIEEIEGVARSERRSWTSHCATLVGHMLKLEHWRIQNPEVGQTWINTILAARRHMRDTLDDNPGLRSQQEEMLRTAWKRARRDAKADLAEYQTAAREGPEYKEALRDWERDLPDSCPYGLAAIEDPEWWPNNVRHKLRARNGPNAVNFEPKS